MVVARSASTLRKLATIRSRMSTRSTLLSSNVNASMMRLCSTEDWLR